MSLQLPFALIPTIAFTSNPRIMGEFANGLASKIFSITLTIGLICINVFFVYQYFVSLQVTAWYYILLIVLVRGCLYMTSFSFLPRESFSMQCNHCHVSIQWPPLNMIAFVRNK